MNVIVLAGLWSAALVLISVGADAVIFAKDFLPRPPDGRALLPAYHDQAFAIQIYADQNKAKRHYVPFTESRHQPLQSTTVNIDENGLRTHRIGRDNDPETVSIGFFGGSAMWGIGADDDGTIPGQFDQMTTHYEVTNYADLAWISRQNLAQLINLINQGEAPAIVIFYDGFNDVAALCDSELTVTMNWTMMANRVREWIGFYKDGSNSYRNLIAPFARLLGSKRMNKSSIGSACLDDPQRAERVAQSMVRNWQIASSLVAGYGGRFVGFLQPNVFVGHPRRDHLRSDVSILWGNRAVAQSVFDTVYPMIRARLAKSGLEWEDMSDVLDGNDYYFVDPSHVAPAGNTVIAKRMVAVIARAQPDQSLPSSAEMLGPIQTINRASGEAADPSP